MPVSRAPEALAGGGFSRAQGAPADFLARWDGAAWQEVGGGLDGTVYALVADTARRELHIGGWFHTAGSRESRNYAIWQVDPVWKDLGNALATTRRTPELTGTGRLLPGSTVRIAISSARETSLAGLVFGASRIDLPVLGGVLVPNPDINLILLTDGVGVGAIEFGWNVPLPGAAFFVQGWTLDPAAPRGISATEALRMRQP